MTAVNVKDEIIQDKRNLVLKPKDPKSLPKYLSELVSETRKSYREQLGFNSIENVEMRSALNQSISIYTYASARRIVEKITPLKMIYTFNKTNMTTTCFKAQIDNTSAIYAYIYSRSDKKGGKPKHQYVTIGGAVNSQDGEYRQGMIPFKQFLSVLEFYAGVLEHVEAMVLRMMEKKYLSFQVDTCYAPDINKSGFDSELNESRYAIKLFMCAWLCDAHRIKREVIENHINPAYQWIMSHKETHKTYQIVSQLLSTVGNAFRKFRISCISWIPVITTDIKIQVPIICGQKIFPITQIETIRLDDITFNVWREIYIQTQVCNLVLNFISPSFPFLNNWFFINNAHAGIYDNFAMHEKFRHSKIATVVAEHLREADRLNYTYKAVDNKKDKYRQPLSSKFHRLSYMISKPTLYADAHMRLSNYAMCVTTESVGYTLRDIPNMVHSRELAEGYHLLIFNLDIFKLHMFEFLYALFTMNKKLNIIHGDLHMNNVTLYRVTYMEEIKYKQVFVIGNKPYVFPYTGVNACIIDFSRAMLGNYGQIEHEFSPRFAEVYFKEQTRKLVNFIHREFQDIYEENKVHIEAMVLDQFPLLFKIVTIVDTHILVTHMRELFETDIAFTKQGLKLAPGIIPFLKKIEKRCRELFEAYLKLSIAGNLNSPDELEWPNLTLIQDFYGEHVKTPAEIIAIKDEIVDAWNENNELINDIDNYDNWGPLLQVDREVNLRKKYEMADDDAVAEWQEIQKYNDSEALDKMINTEIEREGDVLQYADWMME